MRAPWKRKPAPVVKRRTPLFDPELDRARRLTAAADTLIAEADLRESRGDDWQTELLLTAAKLLMLEQRWERLLDREADERPELDKVKPG